VTVWDRQAENCCQYLRKGSAIHVEGSLRMDTWDDKTTGEKRSKIRVHADRVQFLDSRRGDGGDMGGSGDEEMGASPPAREAGPKRSGGFGEPRGGANGAGTGTGRASTPPSSGAARRPPAAEPDERDEEDIPF
jgi:single-strand DNA-binding protein